MASDYPNNPGYQQSQQGYQQPQQGYQQPQQGFQQPYNPGYQQPAYQQEYQYPGVPNYEEEEYVPAENGRGKFSMIGGIITFVVMNVPAFLCVASFEDHDEDLGIAALVGFIVLFIFSIFTLIAGCRGLRISPKAKAIVGLVFSIVNLISAIICIILCFVAIEAASSYHSYTPYYYYGY